MEIKFFKSPSEFRCWLKRHHDTTRELWVGFHKTGSGKPSMTWPESVDQALCFGWIDGLRKSIDGVSYMIRFTPRKPRSKWSAVNIGRVQALIEAGQMQPAGLKAFQAREQAQAGSASNAQQPEQLEAAYDRKMRDNENAWTYFQARPPSYRRLATAWVMSAKQEETRLGRLAVLIECSAQGQPIPPLARPSRTK